MYRKKANKRQSAKQFRKNTSRTNLLNIRGNPMRGGYRL
jgi:hypothetical protein